MLSGVEESTPSRTVWVGRPRTKASVHALGPEKSTGNGIVSGGML
jgi:hypothetical protein